MFFLVVRLCTVERHVCHHTQAVRGLIVALGENGVVKVGAPAHKRLEGFMINDHDGIGRAVESDHGLRPLFTDQRGVTTGNDVAVSVNDTDHAVGRFLHLNDHALKNTARHARFLLILLFTQTTIDIILRIRHYCKRFLTFYFKKRCPFCELFIVLRQNFQVSFQLFSTHFRSFRRKSDKMVSNQAF